MLIDYLPILLQILVSIFFAASALIVSVILGKVGKRSATKDSAYECGMLPEGNAQPRFSVKFYLVALLFVLFDIEIVFMYPWAVVYRRMLEANAALPFPDNTMILWSMLSFLAILTVGYIYALRKGVFDWKHN